MSRLRAFVGTLRWPVRATLIVAGILATGLLGQATAVTASKTSLIWLPTGIAVGLLFRWGIAYWPAVYAGIFLVEFVGHSVALLPAGVAITGTLGTAWTAWLLRRAGLNPMFGFPRDAVSFVLIGAMGMVVTATGGVLWLKAAGQIGWSETVPTWWIWWRGDFAGILLAGPLLISLSRPAAERQARSRVETGFFVGVVLFMSWLINFQWGRPGEPVGAVILIIWAAMRHGIVGGTMTALACSVFAAWAVALGLGSFESESAALFSLWIYMITWCMINLMISVIQSSGARDREALLFHVRRLNETTDELIAGKLRQEAIIERLERSEQEAERASRVKTQFLANMSHEIRTPVAAILGFGEMIARADAESPEKLFALEGIRRNSEHLLSLVDDILDISKIESGRVDIFPVACAPAKVVEQVVLVTTLHAQSRGVPLSSRVAGTLPVCLLDPSRLRQVLVNLVNNAIKFSEPGRPVVLSARLDPAGPNLVFEVADQGIGISAENQEKLFKPFSQVDASMTRKYGGTGLGLHLSARLVEAMGGSIRVASREGEGSRFTVTIPARAVAESDPRPVATALAAAGDPPVDRGPRGRALLVEDSPDIRKIMGFHLEKAGVELDYAENGQVGVDQARQKRYDLILMDIQMPVLDGYQATRALRDLGVTAPIVALTANASTTDRDLCLAAGCDDYLAKPITTRALLDAIDRHLPLDTKKRGQEPISRNGS